MKEQWIGVSPKRPSVVKSDEKKKRRATSKRARISRKKNRT